MKWLNHALNKLSLKNKPAFTIVELLIVIVVIGILASITIVSFGNITGQARTAALQSDLDSNSRKLQLYFTQYGSYPTAFDGNNCPSTPVVDNNYCLKLSSGNTLNTYTGTSSTFSLVMATGSQLYQVTPNTGPTQVIALVTTLAGSGSSNYVDGTGTGASFSYHTSVAVDSSGNVYVADTFNQRIRKITSAGVVTTLAGSGTATFANGTGAAASFYNPSGVAVDSSGNVYVADTNNHRIRKITSAGVVTTLAGSGTATFADGTGTAASFNSPTGVIVDSSGNVFVADNSNNRIRKITSAGVVTTLAGSGTATYADGTGTAASFFAPTSVAVDSSGNVYVADQNNQRIRKITSAGVVTTLAGSGIATFADGTGTAASFFAPLGVAVDSSANIYVGDNGNNRIRKITPTGVVTTLAGSSQSFADGPGASAFFYNPQGLAVDSSNNVYVADSNNYRIRKIQQF